MIAKAVAWQAPIRINFSAGPNAALLTLPNVGLLTLDADCKLVSVTERHETLGTDGSAVTLDVVKSNSGTTMAGGTSLLASTINLKATINTTQSRSISAGTLAADNIILAGQCIGLKFSGTMTAVTGVCVTVILVPLRQPAW
jgi:hypothetical protein